MRAVLFWLLMLPAVAGSRAAAGAENDGPRIIPVDQRVVHTLLAGMHGKVVVLNFWATWCVPCVEEFPDLLKLRRVMADRGVEVVLVSIDAQRDSAAVRRFLRRSGVEFPVYIKRKGNDEGFINAVDARWSGALPATFIYDRDGRMVRRVVDAQTYERLSQLVEPFLSSDKHSGP